MSSVENIFLSLDEMSSDFWEQKITIFFIYIISRHGIEHNTIQYSPDGVHFEVAAISALFPIAPGAYIPDVFLDNGDGRGITWGLCHFRNLNKAEGKSHSMLARFDCDLSLDLHDPEMKETDIFNDPEINFKFGLSEKQFERITKSQ